MSDGWIPLIPARTRLLLVWLGGAGLCFALLLAQTFGDKFGDELKDVWAWFVPTLAPTLALMIAVVGGTSLSDSNDSRMVRRDFFNITIGLSIAYILTLIISMSWGALSDTKPIMAAYNSSNFWLGPLQGIVVASIGYLFTMDQPSPSKPKATRRKPAPRTRSKT